MKIRGDLKVLKDLFIKAGHADAGKTLTVDGSGKVVFGGASEITVDTSKTYTKGSLVSNTAETGLFLAKANGAPGSNLADAKWEEIGGGSTARDIASVLKVGGITDTDIVPAGTDLEAFINKLIHPEVAAQITQQVGYTFSLLPGVDTHVGTRLNGLYHEKYVPGRIKGYDINGNKVTYDLKSSSATFTAQAAYTVKDINDITRVATYGKGTPEIYTSEGKVSLASARAAGSKSYTLHFKGYYKIYLGTAGLDDTYVINTITSGSTPTGFDTAKYYANTNLTDGNIKLKPNKKAIYMVLPKGKFKKFKVVTSTHDTVITDANFENDFTVNIDGTNITMSMYKREIGGGYSSEMSATLYITN